MLLVSRRVDTICFTQDDDNDNIDNVPDYMNGPAGYDPAADPENTGMELHPDNRHQRDRNQRREQVRRQLQHDTLPFACMRVKLASRMLRLLLLLPSVAVAAASCEVLAGPVLLLLPCRHPGALPRSSLQLQAGNLDRWASS